MTRPADTSTTSAWTRSRWPGRCAAKLRGDARCRLLAGDADGARPGRPRRRRGRRGARGARERPARHRLPGAARLRGPRRPPARLQGRHRQVACSRCAPRSARRVLLACSSTSHPRHAGPRRTRARPAQARDAGGAAEHQGRLRGPVAGAARSTSSPPPGTWSCRADAPNLGLGIDSFHILATKTSLDELDVLDPDKIFLVQLADFMWQEVRSFEERMTTARHFRVFPGEGVHSDAARRTGAAPRRAGLPRRLQLRGVQRRLPADPARRRWPHARAARRCGSARRCCAARCRCPTRMRLRRARAAAASESLT